MTRKSSDKAAGFRYALGMLHYLIFGTHPRLSLAEFRSTAPRLSAPIICGNGLVVHADDWDGEVLMNHLGGTVKLGDIVGTLSLDTLNAESLLQLLTPFLPERSFDFGLSLFGGGRGAKNSFTKLPIQLKKAFREHGHSTRWVSGEHGAELSPAAVAKLKLTTEGLDICLLVAGETVYVGKTTAVQDADRWSERDYGRPARDDRNGMLPPKLARMMVNLAALPTDGILLDPFCGSGTIAMEAALATRASHIISSDIENKQIADCQRNLHWLIEQHVLRPDDAERFQTFTADARKLESHLQGKQVDAIVTEGYLGPPLRGNEPQSVLDRNADHVQALWYQSLKEFKKILKPGGMIVGIWPAYKTTLGTARVDLTEMLPSLGYALVDPLGDWERSGGPLVYMRPEQHVARRVVMLQLLGRS